MANQSFKLHSYAKLSSYLRKFSSIEKSLLLEIQDHRLVAKTHTPDKSVVKISSVQVSDIMDAPQGVNPTDVKIGLFAIDNFISSFKHFGDDEVKFEIHAENINSTSGPEDVATEVKAQSKSLKIGFPCASTSMFRYIASDLATKIVDTSTALFSFRIDKDTLGKIAALCGIDSENDSLTVEAKSGAIAFKGKSFELNLPGVSSSVDGEISFYKTHFAFVDKEDSEVFVLDNKIIFKSLETETVIVIGSVQ